MGLAQEIKAYREEKGVGMMAAKKAVLAMKKGKTEREIVKEEVLEALGNTTDPHVLRNVLKRLIKEVL